MSRLPRLCYTDAMGARGFATGRSWCKRLAAWPVWLGLTLLVAACNASLAAQPAGLEPPPLTPRPMTVRATATVTPPSLPPPTATTAPNLLPLPTPTTTTVPPLLPTATAAPELVLLPTPTPWPSPRATRVAMPDATATPAAATNTLAATDQSGNLRATGSYFAQTIFPDGAITQQQGSFTITRELIANAYGDNQRITLTTARGADQADTVTVYQIDDYIAIDYAEGDWVVFRRELGSSIVKAIEPITDLAGAFPTIADQATFIRTELLDGIPTVQVRIDDPDRFGPLLVRPFLGTTGAIRSLQLDAWIDAVSGAVVRYRFQMEITGARVFDPGFNEVLADQSVTWTYQVIGADAALDGDTLLAWPDAAPSPTRLAVPGFEPGAFPLPEDATLRAIIGDVPEWDVSMPVADVAGYYRRVLTAQGWLVEGDAGLLQCSKAETVLQILLTADESGAGQEEELARTRMSVFTVQ